MKRRNRFEIWDTVRFYIGVAIVTLIVFILFMMEWYIPAIIISIITLTFFILALLGARVISMH